MRRSRRLEVRAGSVDAYGGCYEGIEVRFRPRGAATAIRLIGDWLVNCSGPSLDFRRGRNPLVRGLLDQGLARPDPLGLGLDVTSELRLMRADGRANEQLFAVGPLTKGIFWEVTAVPEIRKQGRALAERLIACSMASA